MRAVGSGRGFDCSCPIALAADKDAKAETIDRALGYLREQQMDSGGFGGWGSESPDSTAAVIEALIALKTNLLADEWIKNGKNMVDALLLTSLTRAGLFTVGSLRIE